MELDWSTVALEIVNFLVLIWILQHFLYRPVLDTIKRRQQGIEETLGAAEQTRLQAEEQKSQYSNRLSDWERERTEARRSLQSELEQIRAKAQATLQAELDTARKKAAAGESRRQSNAQHAAEMQALRQSARWASKLLAQLSGPELHARLLDLSLAQLDKLPQEIRDELQQSISAADDAADVQVQSALELSTAQHAELQAALRRLLGRDMSLSIDADASLLAGLRLQIGPWTLRANLKDELQAFAEFGHESDVA